MTNIVLRASGTDSNAGASAFCGFAVPLGLKNGDIAIVAIARPANVVVTPPDDSWTQLAESDPTQFGIVAFWSTVLNAPPSWVFSLSSSVTTTGALAVYANTDSFDPFDATAITVSAQAGSLSGITASLNGDELAAFFVGAGNGTFTPASNYLEEQRKSTASASISFQHKALQNAGAQAAVTETFGAVAAGASLVIAIAPTYGTVSYDDAYQRVFEALPPGIDSVLDFTPGIGDFYNYFWVIGSIVKLCFDLYDLTKQEIVPYLSRYKLPDWERVFGLRGTLTAQTGTIPQRQAQVLGAWRAAAGQGAAIPTVQAILGPLLGYNPTTVPHIVEVDRSQLTLVNSYDVTGGSDVTVTTGVGTVLKIPVNDGGKVAKCGARLTLPMSVTDTSAMQFTLTAPDGTSATVHGSSNAPAWLTFPSLVGVQVSGFWTLQINNPGASCTLYSAASLFVEGVGPNQATGGAIFQWGVYADPAHVGENGTPPDYKAALLSAQKLSFSHSESFLYLSIDPQADITTGANAALADECAVAD